MNLICLSQPIKSFGVPKVLNLSSNPNTTIDASNIDLETPISSSLHPSLLSSDSEKKIISEIELQLAELKGYVNCALSILSNKSDCSIASMKNSFTSSENCEKSNVDFFQEYFAFSPE